MAVNPSRPSRTGRRPSPQEIDAAGGTLTTTGADGTVYHARHPGQRDLLPDRNHDDPARAHRRVPLLGRAPRRRPARTGGTPASPTGDVLTIAPTTPIPEAELLPFTYAGSGENFILYPDDHQGPPESSSSCPTSRATGPATAPRRGRGEPVGRHSLGPVRAVHAGEPRRSSRASTQGQIDEGQSTADIRESFSRRPSIRSCSPTLKGIDDCDPDGIKAAVLAHL